MSNYELISINAVSHVDVSKIITDKESKFELTYREEKIKEYLKKFQKLNMKQYQEAKTTIIELKIPRLDEEYIIKILDLMPLNGTELRAIVSHSGSVLVDESVTLIIDVLNKYR